MSIDMNEAGDAPRLERGPARAGAFSFTRHDSLESMPLEMFAVNH